MRTLILFSALEKQYLIFLEKKTLTHKRRQAADIVKMILDFQMRQLHLLQVEQTANHLAINFYPASKEGPAKPPPPIYDAKIEERRSEMSIPEEIKPDLRLLARPNEPYAPDAGCIHERLNRVLTWFLTRESKCTHYLVPPKD